MGSRKPSAKARRVAEFKAQLGGMDEAFGREREAQAAKEREKEAALRRKACESKKRYATEAEAFAAVDSCADYGTKGLRVYQCRYCKGYHLTSKS